MFFLEISELYLKQTSQKSNQTTLFPPQHRNILSPENFLACLPPHLFLRGTITALTPKKCQWWHPTCLGFPHESPKMMCGTHLLCNTSGQTMLTAEAGQAEPKGDAFPIQVETKQLRQNLSIIEQQKASKHTSWKCTKSQGNLSQK